MQTDVIIKRTILSIAVSFLLSVSASFSQQPESSIQWLKWEDAYRLSKENGKPIFLAGYRNFCSYCKRMDVYVYTDPQIIRQISNNFLPVRIDANDEFTMYELDGQKYTAVQLIKKFNGNQEIVLPLTLMFLTGSEHYFYKIGFQDVADLKFNIIAYLKELSKLSTKKG